MNKERYDELVELYERLESAEKLFYMRYGDLKKVDGKFYWKRLIDERWVRDKYSRTIRRKIPCHWNWSELEPLNCARLFAQGDLPFYYSSDNDDDYDSVGRKIFGDEVWCEASRLFDEDEDGVDYVEWSDLEESTPLIFPEPDPLPSVNDLDDWRSEWYLPDRDDLLGYIKGEKPLADFISLVYCPAIGSIGLENCFGPVVYRTFPVLKGEEWRSYVNDMIDWLAYRSDEEVEENILEDLEAIHFDEWTPLQKEELLKRFEKEDLEQKLLFIDGGYEAGLMWEYIDASMNDATNGRYW